AVVAISSELDLHTVLRRIIESSCSLTGARYGALGILGPGGELIDFVVHGLPGAGAAETGSAELEALPQGRGLLDALVQEPSPPQEGFLGVRVRVRGTIFGNLYLTEKVDGSEFTEDDEALVEALATAAGYVIENARAFATSERRRRLLEATAQVAEALQPPVRLEEAMSQIVLGARRVSGARAAAVVHLLETAYEISASGGPGVDELPAILESLDAEVRAAERADRPSVLPHGTDSVVLVPLRAHLAHQGVLVLALEGGHGLVDPEEVELLATFGDQASLSLDRAQALIDRRELMLTADRERIARDLHDLVIQRLFATGLQLQGARRLAEHDEELSGRLASAVADLDLTIRDIRSSIFELQNPQEVSLRADVRALVREYVPALGFTPIVRTSGPLDLAVSPTAAAQAVAVLREALANVARHAEADACVVEVEADERWVRIRVTDNGRGMPADRHESGLSNARRRAAALGGTLELCPEEPRGTRLEWRAPADA
ncbi:GAF domain-containing sensor histidine kinase, partial [Nocardioides sp.]|uniref:GAF domain-containing sensor histidine kinase n=1 Tax=Nocardioides sp. TaxID=35761 RepID=UPI002736F0B0